MAQLTRHLLMLAAAGTMLTGCSLVGSVADTAWSGTKTVAKWVSSPVRYVLRSSPKTDTQFAGAALETEEPIVPIEDETVIVAEAEMTRYSTVKAQPFVTTVSTVETAPVTAFSPMTRTSGAQAASMKAASTQTVNTQVASYQTVSHHTQTTSMTQAEWSGPIRYSVETSSRGDLVHFVRLKGTSSMSDWMDCDRRAEGYWLTDDASGTINPAFEVCMRGLDYVLETERGSYDTTSTLADASITAPALVKSGPVLAGGSDRPALRSSYVPTQGQTSDLPHKF